ncbi:hypothetical protein H0A36_09095 [Endozoicomonas sp. SM1973]|uniref:HrpF protein n=1 Tax=Spartinivicinus marinus TaxID=2994442 RepID=A0A853I674_9GAMM|nr:hypothetical protein [Spartinivicinus marinus]MCX4028157.1 hypothetical protein [Spartinivicinus marinus]NYZ66168.1 hypothetical protein [Spartinivicinus marinus]
MSEINLTQRTFDMKFIRANEQVKDRYETMDPSSQQDMNDFITAINDAKNVSWAVNEQVKVRHEIIKNIINSIG